MGYWGISFSPRIGREWREGKGNGRKKEKETKAVNCSRETKHQEIALERRHLAVNECTGSSRQYVCNALTLPTTDSTFHEMQQRMNESDDQLGVL